MNTEALVKWINGHDIGVNPVVLRVDGDRLVVQTVEYMFPGSDSARIVQEDIPATLQAARDWLGY
jgi:hypothetical protein